MTRAMSIDNSRRLATILCAALLAAGVSAGAAAQTLTTLYSFPASATDGQNPMNFGALLADAAGALYGTTTFGGLFADGGW